MRMILLAPLLALAACGDNRAAPPDAGTDAPTGCTATFSTNFAEASTRLANCPTLSRAGGHSTLAWSIRSAALSGAPFEISIDLGAAAGPGTYTSQSLSDAWSADAVHEFDMTACRYHAGTDAVPPGFFTLAVDSLSAGDLHGTLDVTLYVLARPFTYCGDFNTERLELSF